MRMGVAGVFAALTIVLAGVAVGQDDPIAAREALMKSNSASSRAAFMMVKGKIPFDAAAAAAAMQEISKDMETFPTLFPPGSEQGENTQASPDIWTNMDDLKALAAQLKIDAKAAADAAANGLDAFTAVFDAVDKDCAACHHKYRSG